jgi:hypothetical protein
MQFVMAVSHSILTDLEQVRRKRWTSSPHIMTIVAMRPPTGLQSGPAAARMVNSGMALRDHVSKTLYSVGALYATKEFANVRLW